MLVIFKKITHFTSVTTSSSVISTAFPTYLTTPSTKYIEFTTSTPHLGSQRTTKPIPITTTAHQTHISTNVKSTLNKTLSTKRPLSSSTLHSTLSKYLTNNVKNNDYNHGR